MGTLATPASIKLWGWNWIRGSLLVWLKQWKVCWTHTSKNSVPEAQEAVLHDSSLMLNLRIKAEVVTWICATQIIIRIICSKCYLIVNRKLDIVLTVLKKNIYYIWLWKKQIHQPFSWKNNKHLTDTMSWLLFEDLESDSAALAEPGRPLPGHLHNPLLFVLHAWGLTSIYYHSLSGRRPQWAAFHCYDLPANLSRLLAHLGVTVATQGVLLLQVAALQTRLNVVLRERERRKLAFQFKDFAIICDRSPQIHLCIKD